MNLEINKELVLSTAHIALEDQQWLQARAEVNYSSDISNYRLCISGLIDCDDVPERLVSLGFLASSHGCKWLVLDLDGDVYDLPTFEWYL